MGKRACAFLYLYFWCLLTAIICSVALSHSNVLWVGLQCVIVVFSAHTHFSKCFTPYGLKDCMNITIIVYLCYRRDWNPAL